MKREYFVKQLTMGRWHTRGKPESFQDAQNQVRHLLSEGVSIDDIRIIERTETVIELPVSAGLTEPEDA